jgi:hypothetical protein
MIHIDNWLNSPNLDKNEGEDYAKFVLDYFRMPAWKFYAYSKWMSQFKLFLTYEGERYRCTMASRMGDIGITKDFEKDSGYSKRVCISKCSNFSNQP